MPGPIVHLIVQQRLRATLRRLDAEEHAERLNVDPCDPWAAFGSMGPDFLFFSLREYGTPLDELTNFIFGVYDAFEPLVVFYEQNIEPIEDKIDEAITTVDDALFGGLFQQLGATADLLAETALVAAGAVVTTGVDFFQFFSPKIQEGAQEKDWYWFDWLHYRRTGEFASNMWGIAQGDPDLERYVLGYVSHIATDVVGHPFVNTITGGPYRTHWHRHKLVENWIDAYARNFTDYRDSRALIRCLDIQRDEKYVANAISGSYYHKLVTFGRGTMPDKLQELLVKAVDQTYGALPRSDRPDFLSGADFDASYRLWLKWFTRSTSIGSGQPPAYVPPPGTATTTLINDYASGMPPFPGPPGAPSGSPSIASILAAILSFAKWVADTVAYTAKWVVDHAVDIITLPYTEAIATTKWLLYQIQKGIFQIYDNLRFMLVLGAYLFPEPRDLVKWPWSLCLLNTSFAGLPGTASPDFKEFPLSQEEHRHFGTTEHHLRYPRHLTRVEIETRETEPMPLPFHGWFPEVFISVQHPFVAQVLDLYDATQPYDDPASTHDIDMATASTAQLGSALDFSAHLIRDRLGKVPNFNLDGDRGYGWKTWRADRPGDINDPALFPVDVQYIDP